MRRGRRSPPDAPCTSRRRGRGATGSSCGPATRTTRRRPAPSVVEFTIAPAWHQYTAVRLGGFLAGGLLVVLAVRRRLKHLRAQTAALAREVEQRRRAESALREEQAQTLALQAQLDHARRLEAIGRLAGGVAHDFNNLLTVAVASLRLLRDELRPAPGGLVAEYLDELDDFSGSATRLTRQLLAFGRRQHLRPVAVDLAVVVDGLLPMLRRLLRSDVGVVVSAEPAPVRADRGQLEQAIVNLVANAAQAIVGSGQVHITVGPVEPAAAAARWPDLVLSGPHACLTVVDDGRGIPPEVLPSIFEPFFTTRPRWQGHGARPRPRSTVSSSSPRGTSGSGARSGSGTRFEVFLPAADAAEASSTAATGFEPTRVARPRGRGRCRERARRPPAPAPGPSHFVVRRQRRRATAHRRDAAGPPAIACSRPTTATPGSP
jgi:signal transduction histidine kinase